MTEKLFYKDCNLRQFEATVLGCTETPKGHEIVLDATAFYPEGGGQACDLGLLGGRRVLDVRERGEWVVHLCDGALTVGQRVEGVIDWERRFDLMQQHTGEHILSGLIHQTFGYHNVGFHMGTGLMEVDFDGPITWEQMMELEQKANAIVWENRKVSCGWPEPSELEKLTYRTKRALPWPVRIVEIPGADRCACCGVHVESTAQVGIIKVLSVTKFHSGVRLQMACGKRAYDYLCMVYEQTRQVSRVFSAKIPEVGGAARKAAEALAAEKFRVAGLRRQVFSAIAAECAGKENVVRFEAELDSAALRELAEKVAAACKGYAALFSGSDGNYNFCLACPGGDLRGLCREMNAALNGRGGGKPEFQQGSLRCSRAEIEAFFAGRSCG